MKKTLNVVVALILVLAMLSSFAYVTTPEKSSEYQISLVSAKSIDVQDTTQGIRSYADLLDTTRIYQVNEVIYLAITTEVKNLEKYPKLKTIEDKDITVVVGSDSIDLSYSKLTTPTLLANVWSGYTATDVATVGYIAPAGTMLTYDKEANEVKWTFRGVSMYGMGGSASYNMVTFDPYFNTATKKIEIPAIKIKDKTSSWVLGGTKFDTTYESPDAIGYTMVITGVTKDNAGEQKGTFYAKVQVSAAEKFEDEGKYYQLKDGTYTDTKPTTGHQWLDWVEIDVDKLEIAGAYTVYKYYLPSSALMYDTAMFYNGKEESLNGSKDTSLWIDNAAVVAHVNPELFDNATNKSNKIGNTLTAGGVKTTKAYATYKDGEEGKAMQDFPLTSIVYSSDKAYYAPGFYGGAIKWGSEGTDPNGGTESTEPVEGFESTGASTEEVEVVEYFELVFPKGSAAQLNYNATDIVVLWSDTMATTGAISGTFKSLYANSTNPTAGTDWDPTAVAQMYDFLATGAPAGSIISWPQTARLRVTDVMKDPSGNVNYTPEQNGNGDYTVRLYPSAVNTLNVIPLNKNQHKEKQYDGKLYTQSMLVYYRNQHYTWSEGQARVAGFATSGTQMQPSSDKFIAPMASLNGSNVYCPVFTEHTKKLTVQLSTSGMSFEALEQNWLKPIKIEKPEQITAVRANMNFEWNTTVGSIAGVKFTGKEQIPIYDLRGVKDNLPAATALGNYKGLKNNSEALEGHADIKIGGTTLTSTVSNIEYASGTGDNVFIYGFKGLTIGTVSGNSVVKLTDLVRWDPVKKYWENVDYNEFLTLPTEQHMMAGSDADRLITNRPDMVATYGDYYRITPDNLAIAAGSDLDVKLNPVTPGGPHVFTTGATYPSLAGFRANLIPIANFTFYKDPGQEADEFYYSYDSSRAAAYSLWDDAAACIVEGHNGITVYSITSYEDERPYVAMATETAYFDSDDGYGIALYDGYNLKSGVNTMAKRIYRTNASNLAYSDGATHVTDSAKIISALSYFGLDTSFDTTFRVTPEVFEAKGAAAVYSEAVEGEFNYGTISIIPDQVEEGTEDEDLLTDGEEIEENEDDFIDEGGDDVVEDETPSEPEQEEVVEDTPEPEVEETVTPQRPVPPTGDTSSNIAIVMALAAIVAAAGLAFVMKKVR